MEKCERTAKTKKPSLGSYCTASRWLSGHSPTNYCITTLVHRATGYCLCSSHIYPPRACCMASWFMFYYCLPLSHWPFLQPVTAFPRFLSCNFKRNPARCSSLSGLLRPSKSAKTKVFKVANNVFVLNTLLRKLLRHLESRRHVLKDARQGSMRNFSSPKPQQILRAENWRAAFRTRWTTKNWTACWSTYVCLFVSLAHFAHFANTPHKRAYAPIQSRAHTCNLCQERFGMKRVNTLFSSSYRCL